MKPVKDMQRALSWDRTRATDPAERAQLRSYIALQMASVGLTPPDSGSEGSEMAEFSRDVLESLREKNRLLSANRPPIDLRIELFLAKFFHDVPLASPLTLPTKSFALDRHGMARELSLPANGDAFKSELLESYRCYNGVLHNPRSDRRTTVGTFHVCDGGLAIPGDKRIVPKAVFAALFQAAVSAPQDLLKLPYTSAETQPSHVWTSLLLRPVVRPEVADYCGQLSMETRFFAPGSLVSNLDFVESIFGNAGDPLLPYNDAALDYDGWSGHTGCVILAPHLVHCTKRQLGLPHISQATPRQIEDRMCWENEDEKYNDGVAFKVTCRDSNGVIITLIADNYFGYCKKEVKTQISYAANLMGGVEEEHAGGALAFASYSLGDEFQVNSRRYNGRTFNDVARDYADFIDVRPEGYGVDRIWPTVLYIPENAKATLIERCIKWQKNGQEHRIPLLPENIYVAPSGYKLRLEKHPAAPSWRLVGTVGEGVLCHKPCTVSGGGKSEISKSLRDYMLFGPIFVGKLDEDFAWVQQIFERDHGDRWKPGTAGALQYQKENRSSRKVLDPHRSVGSVIKLLTPNPDYTDDYNKWLASIPNHIYALALIIKRFALPEWSDRWQERFGVDIVNGALGHELKFGDRKLVGTYLRVGWDEGQWRTFKLRQDFIAADKVQMEDDITASVVVPSRFVSALGPAVANTESYKFVANCEYRLFQRPDDAVHRGFDQQAEQDLGAKGNFMSNFEPMPQQRVRDLITDAIEFDRFTPPMKRCLIDGVASGSTYIVSSSNLREFPDGSRSKNPRYLQDRPDRVYARETYVAHRGMRLARALPMNRPVPIAVGAVLSGRRNNPPGQGFRPLAVYNPLHYQELPELMMDYVTSLSGKSPSTTGAGSEGALTKGPFNAVTPTADLNNALVSMILTELAGFSTPAGHIGPRFEVGHDISLLVPEVWCRLGPEERDPQRMIADQLLEPVRDFEHEGRKVPASRLGYRMTERFIARYFGRVFDNPMKVFTPEILRPELQDWPAFVDGVWHIVEMQQRIAEGYFRDGSIELACPPLKALLHIMAYGQWQGHDLSSPEVRKMFTKDYLLSSDWYLERLRTQQRRDEESWRRKEVAIEAYLRDPVRREVVADFDLQLRVNEVRRRLEEVRSPTYLETLRGTLGAEPRLSQV